MISRSTGPTDASPDPVRNLCDIHSKTLGQKILNMCGNATPGFEILPEVQHADLKCDPHPARQHIRDQFGLLGRLAEHVCIVEFYVKKLPLNSFVRTIAESDLVTFQQLCMRNSTHEPDMEDVKMAMFTSFEEIKAEGRAEGLAGAVLTMLELRGVSVTTAARERVLSERSFARLGDWLKRAAVASALSEVLDESF